MPSSASSPIPRLRSEADEPAPATGTLPIPPDWIITDPEEEQRHVLRLIEQGEREIAEGRTVAYADVQRRVRETIRARQR